MANTTRALLTPSYKKEYYDNQLLYTAEKRLVWTQLGQRNLNVPSGENAYAVVWTRYENLGDRSNPESEGIATTAEAMSATRVTGTVSQYAGAVKLTDLLVATSKDDLKKIAFQRLGYQAGRDIDKVVRNVAAIGGTRVMAGVTAGTFLALWSTVPRTAVLSVTQLRRAIRDLDRSGAIPIGSNMRPNGEKGLATNINGSWLAVTGSDSIYDLQGDTSTGAWIYANAYAGSDKLFTGEVGKMYGIRFLQSGQPYIKNENSTYQSAIATSGEVHCTLVTGADYFGVTKLQNLETYFHDFGSSGVNDPTNKLASAAWKTTFGTRVLNANFAKSIYHSIGRNAE